MVLSSIIKGIGSYLPQQAITNDDLAKTIDTSDEWISSRTGIKIRHLVDKETTSVLAVEAAKIAIKRAGITNKDIDLVIVATTTPDKTFPSTATIVQGLLDIKKGAAFDIQAVCAGFVYALHIADSMIKINNAKNVLVIGAETMSKLLDWQDRRTCVLFGDGAGAVVLSASDDSSVGIIDTKIYSDGNFANILNTSGGVSATKTAGVVNMDGKEVFKHAVNKMSDVMLELINSNGFSVEDINYFIPHQANIRIIESISKKLDVSKDKMVVTIDKHANTSAASIPLALNSLHESNKIKKGDLILTSAIGGGLAWGGALIRWCY